MRKKFERKTTKEHTPAIERDSASSITPSNICKKLCVLLAKTGSTIRSSHERIESTRRHVEQSRIQMQNLRQMENSQQDKDSQD